MKVTWTDAVAYCGGAVGLVIPTIFRLDLLRAFPILVVKRKDKTEENNKHIKITLKDVHKEFFHLAQLWRAVQMLH
jgi:hypothetical protein